MNILHVLSQYEVNGAETYAATLANASVTEGDTVVIVSDTFHTPTSAQVFLQPIGKRSYPQRLWNIRFLSSIIREKRIDVVHAHSRAAAWVSYFATRLTGIPLVSSIHMRQHIHFTSKHFSVYGDKLIAVCGAIYDHLRDDMKYPESKLVLIPNGIDCTRWHFQPHRTPSRETKLVAVVGRFTGFKGESLLTFLHHVVPRVCSLYPAVEFHIVGGMSEREKVEHTVATVNAQLGKEYIVLKGFTFDIETVYHTADVVVGAGRVAMEALACGTPVVAVGESSVVGLVSPETAERAYYSNFGDLDRRMPLNVELCVQSLLAILQTPTLFDPKWGRSFIEEHYNVGKVHERVRAVYQEVSRARTPYA